MTRISTPRQGLLPAVALPETSLSLTLDSLPPSTNNLYATVRGRRVLSKAGRAWKASATVQVANAAQRQGWQLPPRTPYVIYVTYHAPKLYTWDVDGKAKVLIDAIAAAIGVDDCYVLDAHLSKRKAQYEAVDIVVCVARDAQNERKAA